MARALLTKTLLKDEHPTWFSGSSISLVTHTAKIEMHQHQAKILRSQSQQVQKKKLYITPILD
jgi:hypothetical protein